MSLLLKILASILGFIILVIGGAALYFSTIFNANDYKTEIQAVIKEHTHFELNINGDLQLSIFPWLGLSVEDITVNTSDTNTTDQSLASIGYARIFTKVASLLKGKLEIDGVSLHDLKLNLSKNANGRGNWDIESSSTPSEEATPSKPFDLKSAGFTVGYLEIANAEIFFKDIETDSFHQLKNLNFNIDNVSPNSNSPIKANFDYLSNTLDQPLQIGLSSQAALNLKKGQLLFSNTQLNIGDTHVKINLGIKQLDSSPIIEAQLSIADFKPSSWSRILQNPDLANMTLDVDFKTGIEFNMGTGKLALKNLIISSPHFEISGSINASGLNDTPSYLGKLTINNFNPSALLLAAAVELPQFSNTKTLKDLTGQIKFSGTDNSLQLSNINLKLDDSKLQGSAEISSFSSMASRFSLSIDQLDVDRYLPVTQVTPTTNEKSKTTASPNEELIPVETLQIFDTNGRLRIGKLASSGLQINKFDATLSAKKGFIKLKSLTGNFYHGDMLITASVDARNSTPRIKLNTRLNSIQAGPLLLSLAEVDYVAGTMDLQIEASAVGKTLLAIKRTLDGEVSFNVQNGILKNTNIEQLVCKSIAWIGGHKYTPSKEDKNTNFNKFNAHMDIVNGVMQTDRMLVSLSNIKVNGNGIINLIKESIDYNVQATIIGSTENQACKINTRYRDIAWPLNCKGSFSDDPSKLCGVDQRGLQKIAAQLAKNKIKNKAKEALKKKLEGKLGDEAVEKLKNWFNF